MTERRPRTTSNYLGSTSSSVSLATTISLNSGSVDVNAAANSSIGTVGANSNRPFDGLIDNFALYSGLLSAGDLENLRLEALAVPEPSTYALLLASLGIILLARRRRALNR